MPGVTLSREGEDQARLGFLALGWAEERFSSASSLSRLPFPFPFFLAPPSFTASSEILSKFFTLKSRAVLRLKCRMKSTELGIFWILSKHASTFST